MSVERDSNLRWHRIQVHAIEREGVGFYAHWHVTAEGRAGVERILASFAEHLGYLTIEIDQVYEEDKAKQHEQRGIRQVGGRMFYDENVGAPGDEPVYKVQRWPFSELAKRSWKWKIRRFNRTLRTATPNRGD